MRHIALIISVLVGMAGSAFAETIKVSVNGMVCAFCATGIEKKFKAEPEVESVKVDLAKKLVTVKTKPGQPISDAKVKEVITYTGYSLTGIVREK